jgi:hypothetical protein
MKCAILTYNYNGESLTSKTSSSGNFKSVWGHAGGRENR